MKFMRLREVLRDVKIANLHPEPNVAAAMQVVENFSPQINSAICNYSSISHSLELEVRNPCPCKAFVNANCTLSDGHVLTTDPAHLN